LLKGQVGDEINVLMAACAWNLRKWLIATAIFLFWQKVGLLIFNSVFAKNRNTAISDFFFQISIVIISQPLKTQNNQP
jgi:hypothetical protein